MLSLCGRYKVSRSRPHQQPKTYRQAYFRGLDRIDGFLASGIRIQSQKIRESR
jgi:hypothetical protein